MDNSKIWLIYVGANKKILPNYQLGMTSGVWGFDKLPKKNCQFKDIKAGDTVLFAHKMSWPVDEGKAPGWFPKFCSDVNIFKCNLKEIIETKVTKSSYETEVPLWSDKLYPYRFNFETVKVHENIKIRPESFDIGYSNAIMLSIGAGGKLIALDAELKVKTNKGSSSKPTSTVTTTTSNEEGNVYYRLHKKRERDPQLAIDKKKKVFEETGTLSCEICEFSFEDTYGERGAMYAECHHKNPLADLADKETIKTSLEDLAIVCANCHRMIHRRRPWLDIDTIKGIYEEQRNTVTN